MRQAGACLWLDMWLEVGMVVAKAGWGSSAKISCPGEPADRSVLNVEAVSCAGSAKGVLSELADAWSWRV